MGAVQSMDAGVFDVDFSALFKCDEARKHSLRVLNTASRPAHVMLLPKEKKTTEGIEEFAQACAQPDIAHIVALFSIYNSKGEFPHLMRAFDAIEQVGMVPPRGYLELSQTIHNLTGLVKGNGVNGLDLMVEFIDVLEKEPDLKTPLYKSAPVLPELVQLGMDIEKKNDKYFFVFPYSASPAMERTKFLGTIEVGLLINIFSRYVENALTAPTFNHPDIFKHYDAEAVSEAILSGILYTDYVRGDNVQDDDLEYIASHIWQKSTDEGGMNALIDLILQTDTDILQASKKNNYVPVQSFRQDTAQAILALMKESNE